MCLRRFSHEDDCRLVESIMEFPVIYNHERFYSSKNSKLVRDNWLAVSAAVGKEEDVCKKRWRDIRDHYFKLKRKQQRRGSPIITRWPIFDKLFFLDNAKRYRRTITDSPHDQEEVSIEIYEPETTFKVETDSGSESARGTESPSQLEYVSIPPPSAITGFYSPEFSSGKDLSSGPDSLGKSAEDNDVDSFMRSIAFTVKKFPPRVRAEAKLKILAVVTELEFPGRWQFPVDCTKQQDQPE